MSHEPGHPHHERPRHGAAYLDAHEVPAEARHYLPAVAAPARPALPAPAATVPWAAPDKIAIHFEPGTDVVPWARPEVPATIPDALTNVRTA